MNLYMETQSFHSYVDSTYDLRFKILCIEWEKNFGVLRAFLFIHLLFTRVYVYHHNLLKIYTWLWENQKETMLEEHTKIFSRIINSKNLWWLNPLFCLHSDLLAFLFYWPYLGAFMLNSLLIVIVQLQTLFIIKIKLIIFFWCFWVRWITFVLWSI